MQFLKMQAPASFRLAFGTVLHGLHLQLKSAIWATFAGRL
jgi:hypothetical protein